MNFEELINLPRVTIMIPTYLQEDVILDAVDSALAQDYPNLEVIVADDASPDRTMERVASRKDSRLHYHRNLVNLGRVANYRNTLYELATGEWVVNLDGDDYYTNPSFISRAINTARSDPDIVIVAGNCQFVVDGKPIPLSSRPCMSPIKGIEVISKIYDKTYHFFHMSTIYYRPAALALDFYRADVVSSDWESLYRLALCGKVAFADDVAGVWRVSGHNASLSLSPLDAAKNLTIWETIFVSAAKRNNITGLYIPKQKILFSEANKQMCVLWNEKSKNYEIIKYIFYVNKYSGIFLSFYLFLKFLLISTIKILKGFFINRMFNL